MEEALNKKGVIKTITRSEYNELSDVEVDSLNSSPLLITENPIRSMRELEIRTGSAICFASFDLVFDSAVIE